ncbi:MAG: nucleotidyl transferase AbiEii/AbiGii toxin family protein [Ginsengibacter sp.]
MLFKEAVRPSTLELVKSLQDRAYLDGFYLVGGTALALYYGHRQSIDIDLFTNLTFDTEFLLEKLTNDFSYQLTYSANHTLKGSISQVKVDIISHAYPYIGPACHESGLSLLSEKDIIAMKLNAISISGQRSKDFIDIYYALRHFSISEIISFYAEKYRQLNSTHVIKSLIYFDDVDLADWPVMIKDPGLKWDSVKQKIRQEVMALL